MRVGFLTHSLSSDNGWGRFSVEILNRMQLHDIEPVVLTRFNENRSIELPNARIYDCLPHFASLEKLTAIFKVYLQIKKFFRNCSVIHCITEPYVPLAMLLSLGKQSIISGHGTYLVQPFQSGKPDWVYRLAYRKADRIICHSRYTTNKLLEYMPNLTNLLVVNLGVDPLVFAAQSNRPKREGKIILSVGAIKERKGYEFSIRAFGEVVKVAPKYKYVIIGPISNQDYKDHLDNIARELQLEKKVLFLTDVAQSELVDWYHAAELFVLTPVNTPQGFEGFGLVYLEAGACGLPSIGTLNCGAEDAVRAGFTGLLVPQRDVDALAQAMIRLLEDEDLRRQMGREGQRYARARTWEQVTRQIVDSYGKSRVATIND